MQTNQAQGAIEYLLIIAAAILVVAIVILAVTGALSGGQDQAGFSEIAKDDAFNSLKEESGEYVRLGMMYYLKSSPLVEDSILLFHMEDATDSISGETATITGDPQPTEGIIKNAYEFDGGDYITISNPPTDLSGDLTLALWINPNSFDSYRRNPLDKSYGGEFALTLEDPPDLGRISYYHGTRRQSGYYWSWDPFPNGTIKSNQWQFIVITRNSSTREMKSYYNGNLLKSGVLYSSTPEKLPSQSTYNIKIGSGYVGNFIGKIDEVVILDRVLTDEEVMQMWAGK